MAYFSVEVLERFPEFYDVFSSMEVAGQPICTQPEHFAANPLRYLQTYLTACQHTYNSSISNRTHQWGHWKPIDMSDMLYSNVLSYVQFVAFLGKLGPHQQQLQLNEVAVKGHPSRLFIDLDIKDCYKNGHKHDYWQHVPDYRNVPGLPVDKVMDILGGIVAQLLELRRAPYMVAVMHEETMGKSGVHIVFPGVFFRNWQDDKTVRTSTAARFWAELRRRAQETFVGDNAPAVWEFDWGCSEKGSLRMPYQLKAGEDASYPQYNYGILVNGNDTSELRGSSLMVNSCILVPPGCVSNPDHIDDLYLPQPVTIAPLVRTFTVPQGTNGPTGTPPAPRNNPRTQNAGPPVDNLTAQALLLNQPRNGNFRASHAYGEDFTCKHLRYPVPLSPTLFDSISRAVKDNINPLIGTKDEINEIIVHEMNKHFAFIESTRRVVFRDISEMENSNVMEYKEISAEDFKTRYNNLIWKTPVQTPVGVQIKDVYLAKMWLNHLDRRTYRSTVFSPFPRGHPESGTHEQLNYFDGYRWTESELLSAVRDGDMDDFYVANFIQNHVFTVICNSNPQKFQFFMMFWCKKFLEPWFRPNCSFIVTGNEGCGKSSLFEGFVYAMGRHGLKCTNIQQLLGQFNHTFKDKLFIFCDEATYVGDAKAHAAIKNLITSDLMWYEAKFQAAEVRKTYATVTQVSNSKVVVFQGEDCRRFIMYHCKNHSQRNQAAEHSSYFDEFFKYKQNDYRPFKIWLSQFYFRQELYSPDLMNPFKGFSHHFFPEECLKESERQKTYSHCSVTKFWQYVLDRGFVYPVHLDWALNASPTDGSKHLTFARDATSICMDGRRFSDLLPMAPIRGGQAPHLARVPPPTTSRSPSPFINSPSPQRMDEERPWNQAAVDAFEHRITATRVPQSPRPTFRDGDIRMDFPLNPGQQNLAKTMWETRNPSWNPRQQWLGTVVLDQAYQEYQKMRSSESNKRVYGLDARLDPQSFKFETERIFNPDHDDNRRFFYHFPAHWRKRSENREFCQTDKEWPERRKAQDCTGYADTEAEVFVLGSLDDCKGAFYRFTGVDLTPDKRFQTADFASRPKVFDTNWSTSAKKVFETMLQERNTY
jgi:hypothetical protein